MQAGMNDAACVEILALVANLIGGLQHEITKEMLDLKDQQRQQNRLHRSTPPAAAHAKHIRAMDGNSIARRGGISI
jgi:hypothetical protein